MKLAGSTLDAGKCGKKLISRRINISRRKMLESVEYAVKQEMQKQKKMQKSEEYAAWQ